MSVCGRCQHQNPDGAVFCNACGGPLETRCPACRHVNPPASRFCNRCGAVVVDRSASAPPGRFSAPASYTPRHPAERILTSRAALEGERKQVTVIFADVKGSMELLADRDPEEACRLYTRTQVLSVMQHVSGEIARGRDTSMRCAADRAPVPHDG